MGEDIIEGKSGIIWESRCWRGAVDRLVLIWLGWKAHKVRLYKDSLFAQILSSRPLLLAAIGQC